MGDLLIGVDLKLPETTLVNMIVSFEILRIKTTI
jgi:hypothetical protein